MFETGGLARHFFRRVPRAVLAPMLVLPAALAVSLVAAAPAGALGTSLFVSSTGTDTGDCSTLGTACATITYALTQAADGATINVSGTIKDNVTTSQNVTITGVGAASPAVIDAGENGGGFLLSGTVVLDDLTIENGKVTADGAGIASSGDLTVSNSTITGNTALDGGGLAISSGTATIQNSVVSNNTANGLTASGGGLYQAGGNLAVFNSTFSGNTSADDGGGIFGGGENGLQVTDSTFTGNSALNDGGGLWVGSMMMVASTVAGNSAPFGAGVFLMNGSASILSSTLESSSSENVFNDVGTLTLGGTILHRSNGADCSSNGTIQEISLGYNFHDGTCVATGPADNTTNVDPLLGPLQNNGGPTETMALQAGSPAIGVIPSGTSMLCPRVDQRGLPSIPGNACDSGAYQSTTSPLQSPTISSVNHTSFTIGSPGSFTFTSIGVPIPAPASDGVLPSGVTFTDNHDGTATLSGTPAPGTGGDYPLTFTASNSTGPDATQSFTLHIAMATQATLTVTSTSGTSGTALPLTTTGGSGGGVVTFVATDGSASGCTVSGSSLSVSSAGTCSVTATKAADATFAAISSAATTVTFKNLPSILFVSSTGTNTGDCSSVVSACATVSYALTQAGDKATINVSGTIKDNIQTFANVTITGANAPANSPAILDGAGENVLFTNGTASLDDLTIRDGGSFFSASGGGIFNNGDLTINDCTISANTLTDPGGGGGGINNQGDLTITNSTITGNTAAVGGGLSTSSGTVLIENSVVSDNTATKTGISGGGIYVEGGNVTVLNSTVSGNTSPGDGGGIVSPSSNVLHITNSTITGNSANQGGGVWTGNIAITASTVVGNTASSAAGVYVQDSAATIIGSTFENSGSANIESGGGSLTLGGTILHRSDGSDCQDTGTVSQTSLGYNFDDASCMGTSTGPGDNTANVDPLLGTLQNNGGPTQTMALHAGSPAIGVIPSGTSMLCPRVDERGVASIPGAACDSGAYQSSSLSAQAALTITSLGGVVGTPLTLTTSGGSGTGAVTFVATNGTATGCTVSGSSLSVTTAGTCNVTATKAADANFSEASSAPTTVTFSQGTQAALTHHLAQRSCGHAPDLDHFGWLGQWSRHLYRHGRHRHRLHGQRVGSECHHCWHLQRHGDQGGERQLRRHVYTRDFSHL